MEENTMKAADSASKSSEAAKKSPNDVAERNESQLGGSKEAERTTSSSKARRIEDLLTQISMQDPARDATGKMRKKDMSSYKFWQTQPVSRFDESVTEEGPIEPNQSIEAVPTHPLPLLKEFEWVVMDVNDRQQLEEIRVLLSENFVEDGDHSFRLNYSASFLQWALKPPHWRKEWHVGVRVVASHKLVAFISGIPVNLRVRATTVACSEINFLCVHKKLRSKRLTPLLIKEVTRQCHLQGVWQAIYTAGVLLPKPITTARYFHRCLDWPKLNEVGFSGMPPNSSKKRQVEKYRLPAEPSISGLREMNQQDVEGVEVLLQKYLSRFDLAQQLSEEEVSHWFVNQSEENDKVIWTFVVEDHITQKVTDFVSFYSLPSTIIGSAKHKELNVAYLYYYASEVALQEGVDKQVWKGRLTNLVNDALILAKNVSNLRSLCSF